MGGLSEFSRGDRPVGEAFSDQVLGLAPFGLACGNEEFVGGEFERVAPLDAGAFGVCGGPVGAFECGDDQEALRAGGAADGASCGRVGRCSQVSGWFSPTLKGSIPRMSLARSEVGRLVTYRWEYIR